MAKASISALVLTRNEECNIKACLESLNFCDDIVVLDSMSTDRTVSIAKSVQNVRVFERPFDTEWKQRNFGLHEIEYRHEWVYVCDADERVPSKLAEELQMIANRPQSETVAYRLRYKNFFMGRWIRHATSYPVWIIRFMRPDRVHYEQRETNVHPVVEGETGVLQSHFEHYSFNAGLRRWFEKHNFYSTLESAEGVAARTRGLPKLSNCLTRDPMVRRRALKDLSFQLRGRGAARFFYSYLIGGGFLDGVAGLHYCSMIATYEHWIEMKMRERLQDWNGRIDMHAQQLLKEPEK